MVTMETQDKKLVGGRGCDKVGRGYDGGGLSYCCVPFVSEVGSRNDVTPDLNAFHLCFSVSSRKRTKMTTDLVKNTLNMEIFY